jgi:hypothetical protein
VTSEVLDATCYSGQWKYRLEGFDRLLLYVILGQIILCIVDSESSLGTRIAVQIAGVDGDGLYTVIGAVGMLEV